MKPSLAQRFAANPVHWFAFGFGSGLAPRMPGTFGTAVGVGFFCALRLLGPAGYLILALLFALLGIPLCGASARDLGVHDHPAIVWDEVVGYLVTMLPLVLVPAGADPWWWWAGTGFILFRLFDIVKPGPIRWLDRRVQGGLGIMLDDLAAGAGAALCLWLLLYLAAR